MYSAEVTSRHYFCPCQKFIQVVVFFFKKSSFDGWIFWKTSPKSIVRLQAMDTIVRVPNYSTSSTGLWDTLPWSHSPSCKKQWVEHRVITLIHHHYPGLRLHGQISLSCLCFLDNFKVDWNPKVREIRSQLSTEIQQREACGFVDQKLTVWPLGIYGDEALVLLILWRYGIFFGKKVVGFEVIWQNNYQTVATWIFEKIQVRILFGVYMIAIQCVLNANQKSIGVFFHVFSKAES